MSSRSRSNRAMIKFRDSVHSPSEADITLLDDQMERGIRYRVASSTEEGISLIQSGNSSVNFSGCAIDENDAKRISDVLRSNRRLKALDISGTKISTVGLGYIVASLMNNTTLVHLNVSRNELGVKGAETMARLIKKNISLISIWMTRSRIRDGGARHIINAMQQNSYVISLNWIHSEIFEDELTDELQRVLNKNQLRYKIVYEKFLKDPEATTPWRQSKLMIVGETGTGKTAVKNLLLGRFIPNSTEPSSTLRHTKSERTNSKTERTRSVSMNENGGVEVSLSESAAMNSRTWFSRAQFSNMKTAPRLHDSPAETKFFVKRFSFTQEAACRVVNEEIEALDKLTRMQKLKTRLKRRRGAVLTTGDPREAGVPDAEGVDPEAIAKSDFDANLCVKCKVENEKVNLSVFDYKGGSVFSTLHHLFLSENGVYIVVFSMKKIALVSATRNEMDHSLKVLRFWLNSIKLHAPNSPVLLVGTGVEAFAFHTNRVLVRRKILEGISKVLEEKLDLKRSFPNLITNHNPDIAFFPVGIEINIGVEQLRKSILKNVKLSAQIPISWFRVLDRIYNYTFKSKNKHYIRRNEVHSLAKKYLLNTDVDALLNFFHQKGVLLHFPTPQNVSELVIVKPEWLIKKFSQVLSRLAMMSRANHGAGSSLSDLRLLQEWRVLRKKGIVTRDLLEYLWGYKQAVHNCSIPSMESLWSKRSGSSTFRTMKRKDRSQIEYDFLIGLMTKLFLLNEVGGNKDEFLVPSLVTNYDHFFELKPLCEQNFPVTNFLEPDQGVDFFILFDFSKSFFPLGFFERFLSLCSLSEFSTHQKEVKLKHVKVQLVEISFEKDQFSQIFIGQTSCQVYVKFIVKPTVKAEEMLFLEALENFEALVRKVDEDFMSGGLRWETFLGNDLTSESSFHDLKPSSEFQDKIDLFKRNRISHGHIDLEDFLLDV